MRKVLFSSPFPKFSKAGFEKCCDPAKMSLAVAVSEGYACDIPIFKSHKEAASVRLLNTMCYGILALAGMALSAPGQNVPFATKVVSMEYPRLAAAARITGTAALRVRIDSSGKVLSATGLSGHPLLIKGAAENIMLWKFSAGKSAGAKAESEFDFSYVFKLKGVSDTDRTCSGLAYEYPNKVTVLSEALPLEP